MDRNDLHPCEKYCVVRKGTSWFALPAVSVREVCNGVTTVTVPRAHPALAGLCHVRSEFLAVLSLVDLAGEQETPLGDDSLLVMTGPSGNWALHVDEVAAIASLEVSAAAELAGSEDWTNAILGSATYQDKVVRILDPNRLYRLAEQQVREAWGTPQAAWTEAEVGSSVDYPPRHRPGIPRAVVGWAEVGAGHASPSGAGRETLVEGEHR